MARANQSPEPNSNRDKNTTSEERNQHARLAHHISRRRKQDRNVAAVYDLRDRLRQSGTGFERLCAETAELCAERGGTGRALETIVEAQKISIGDLWWSADQ